MTEKKLFEMLRRYWDPDRVFQHAAAIFDNDRWNTSTRYLQTADYLEAHFKEYKADQVERISIPCDGVYQFGDWIMPLAWDAEEGLLELLDADGKRELLLADYRAVPNNLIRWSRGTARQGEVLNIVYLPDASQERAWQAAATKGKLVFTHSALKGNVHALACRYGAEGLVTDFSTDPVEYNKEVYWWNSWTSWNLWGTLKKDKQLLGFSLSPEKGKLLKEILTSSAEPRKFRATVHAKLYKGVSDIISATIEGDEYPRQEVICYAHVYECQIDDNAVSGGMFLEMIRILKQLIDAGIIQRPRRSIRFVLGWEWIGSLYYAMQCKKDKVWLASLCSDGVGTKQKYTREPLCLYLSPALNTSFADGLFVDLWKTYFSKHLPMISWRTMPWNGGTDTCWVDPMVGNVSNIWPYQGVGPTWHKSHSTLELLDPEVVKYSGLTTLMWALSIADATTDDALRFAKLGADRAENEIRRYGNTFDFERSDVACARKRFHFDMACLQKKAAKMMATAILAPQDKRLTKRLGELSRRIARAAEEEKSVAEERFRQKAKTLPAWEAARPFDYRRDSEERIAGNIIPHRILKGVLWSLDKFSPQERSTFSQYGMSPYYLFLCDGKRSLLDVVWEYEREYHGTVNLRNVIRAFEMLRRAGYVNLRYKQTFSKGDVLFGLRKLGVKAGNVVLLHSSLFGVGPLEDGADTLFDALEEAVGPAGTLVLPACAYNTTRDYPQTPFDPAQTPARDGQLPARFLKRPGVLRSRHPSHGLAAKGRRAAYLLDDNLPYAPYDIRGAFGKLYQLDAKVLVLGCGLAANSTLHALEDWLGLPSMQPDTFHYLEQGKRHEIRYEKEPRYHRDFYALHLSSYERLFREKGILREDFVGLARSFLMSARKMLDCGINEARKGSFNMLFCNDPNCSTCPQMKQAIKDSWRFPGDLLKTMRNLRSTP